MPASWFWMQVPLAGGRREFQHMVKGSAEDQKSCLTTLTQERCGLSIRVSLEVSRDGHPFRWMLGDVMVKRA